MSRGPYVIGAEMGANRVLLSPRLEYLELQGWGSRVWDLLERPRTIAALVATLTGELEVDEATCRDEVVRFVRALHEHELVHVA